MAFEQFFAELREQCEKRTWSQAVEIARSANIYIQKTTANEIAFAVTPVSSVIAQQVCLYLSDQDWTCDCHSEDDPCVHVIAAAIAKKQGLAVAAEQSAHIGEDPNTRQIVLCYAFSVEDESLTLQRQLVYADGRRDLITKSMVQLAKELHPRFTPSQLDFSIESCLGTFKYGKLPPGLIPNLCKYLEELQREPAFSDNRLQFLEHAVRFSGKALSYCVIVRDQDPGVSLHLELEQPVERCFQNHVALIDHTMRPVARVREASSLSDYIQKHRFFGPKSFNDLMSTTLPKLRQMLPVQINTTRLPQLVTAQVEPVVHAQAAPNQAGAVEMSVVVRIGYFQGRTLLAEVVDGRLVVPDSMSAKPKFLPEREPHKELKVRDEVWQDFGLELEHIKLYRNDGVFQFLSKVKQTSYHIVGTAPSFFSIVGDLEPKIAVVDQSLNLRFDLNAYNQALSNEETEAGALTSLQGKTGFSNIKRAWETGQSFIQVGEHSWARLPVAWLQQNIERITLLIEQMDAAKHDNKIPIGSIGLVEHLLDSSQDDGFEEWHTSKKSILDNLLRTKAGGDSIKSTNESLLQATLRPYQKVGVAWLETIAQEGLGGILADDMGLGKTLQACAILKKHTLILVPTSLLSNWAMEIGKFRPDLRVGVYHGANREHLDSLLSNADVIITSYTLMRIEQQAFVSVNWYAVICDEAQYIKNPTSQIAQAVPQLRAHTRLALSGTPIENHLSDLWSIMNFVLPGLLGSYSYFSEHIGRRLTFNERNLSDSNGQQKEIMSYLRQSIEPFILRREKQAVAKDLPPKTEIIVPISLSDEEQTLYDQLLASARREIHAELDKKGISFTVLERLLRLRQAACDRALLQSVSSATVDRDFSTKVTWLCDKLVELKENGLKALVFSQWTSFLDRIEAALHHYNVDFLRIDGSVKDRASVVSAFQDSSKATALLLSLKAGGVGLNLTAADHVIIMDPWWNPAAEKQAADRAHRIGQTKPVFVHKLIAMNTLEEQLITLQERKLALYNKLLSEDDQIWDGASAEAISKDDVMALLS